MDAPVITFTTVPPRISHLGEMLAAIGRQQLRPRAVELYLPLTWRRFPGQRPSLPPLPDWLTVVEVEKDLGPATKILPALTRHAGQEVDLLLCDDDMVHDPGWTSRLVALRRERPDDVVCEFGMDLEELCQTPGLQPDDRACPRAQLSRPSALDLRASRRRMAEGGEGLPYLLGPGYVDVLFGFRGAMLRPGWVAPEAWKLPDIIWTVDDVWLSGMAALAGRRIWAGGSACWMQGWASSASIDPLVDHVEMRLDRKAANRLCIDYLRARYGVWRQATPAGAGTTGGRVSAR